MTFLQAIVIGLVQGVTELFPVSSLGHTVLVPALIGGSWARLVTQEASAESPYLAFVVGLHLATAAALIAFFWKDWRRVIAGLFRSVTRRKVESDDERLAWLIILATIPVGILGLLLEHPLRVLFAVPLAAAGFLTLNGLILLVGSRLGADGHRSVWRPRPAAGTVDAGSTRELVTVAAAGWDASAAHGPAAGPEAATGVAGAGGAGAVSGSGGMTGGDRPEAWTGRRRAARLGWLDAIGIGVAQSTALLAGISRDGICMVAGLARGLPREEAVRFAFLLSAPPIFAAGLLKVPDLLGPLGNGIRPQIVVGSMVAFLTALGATAFLVRYFRTRSLRPMAVYCLLFGLVCMVRFGLF